ncbi:MAG TPA: SpoIIE family protein phosphatase [Candidatus Saccharimonadales bacterium]|jgi:sigma-B regulation protein RsbU (phosphoserine phosphatase)|nr:SpoIIE family protein phosphatase [Candidatus Saccharimonadales bacterium]
MRKLLQFASSKARPCIPVQAVVPDLQRAQLAAVYYGQRIAGDFYDFLRVSPTRVLFGLLDVAGRLDDTREIVSAAQNTFRSAGADLFAQEDMNESNAMIELGIQLNRSILNTAGHVCSSPAFAGCYNETLGTVCYVNAGHTPGLVRDGSGISELPATGLPLGLFSHSTTDASIVALQPGAILLVVSRGIIEARNKGEDFGLRQVKDNLELVRTETAQQICASILDKVQEFTHQAPTHNDVTVLALARHARV